MATHKVGKKKVLEELNEKHAVVMLGGKTVILNEDFDPNFNQKTVTFSSVPDFKLRYQNRSIQLSENDERSIADFWLSHSDRRQFQGIKFKPYGPNSNADEREGEFFNLFRGWPVTPRKGNSDLYWNHVHDIICNRKEELYEYVRKWMAQAVQFPQVLPETAVILRGGQGVGKDMFARYFGKLFGQHYLVVFSMDQVAGRFNGHLANVLLLHANEAFWTGKKSIEGILKGMVTDPTVPIEYKGKDIININNYKRIIICSNESVPVPVGLDDRRFLLLDVSDKFKEDRKYFGSLINQMDNGGLEALMLDLINEDLSNFDVRSKPKQSNLLDLKLIHAEPHIRWWHECLFNGDLSFADLNHEQNYWENPIDKSYLYNNYKEFCNNHEKTKPVPNSDFYKKMIGIHPGCKKARPTINGKRPHCIQFPPLARCRQDFEKVINNKVDWPETERAEASLSCPPAILMADVIKL